MCSHLELEHEHTRLVLASNLHAGIATQRSAVSPEVASRKTKKTPKKKAQAQHYGVLTRFFMQPTMVYPFESTWPSDVSTPEQEVGGPLHGLRGDKVPTLEPLLTRILSSLLLHACAL